MSRVKIVAVALFVAVAFTTVLAQNSSSSKQGATEERAGRHDRVQDRLEWMSKELNLTDDQKAKLKPILQDEGKQMRAVHEDNSLTPEQKREKAKQIRENFRPQIQAVLTPEQKAKLKTLREEGRERHQKKEEPKQ